jgi:pimeloyl-ACP methyl ester carboxylesterase
MFAPSLAGGLARHDRAVFERASASPAMIRALVESLTATDVRDGLAEVAVPALVMHRRSDFVPVAEARLTVRGIREARLVELEGSDHLPWGGDIGAVLFPVADFVGEVSRRPHERASTVAAARTRRPPPAGRHWPTRSGGSLAW